MLEKKIASLLLDIEAVALRPHQPFTWTSGIQSPIYCDNRLTMSYPEVREQIANGFVQMIQEKFGQVDVIAGTATAGIPHAAWVAQLMNLPMIYIRDKAKAHGKGNRIEGKMDENDSVVLIEDLISTGGSSLKAAEAIEEAGGKVLGILAIFTYELEKAEEAFAAKGIPLYTLSNYSALIDVAKENGVVEHNDVELLQSFRQNPERYGEFLQK